MKKICFFVLVVLLGFGLKAKADEGMWLPLFIERLNYVDMQKMGLHLTAEELFSINHSSLKDAIVHFGGGCTAEIVSDQGLLFTNHHCGYGSIQDHSSVEHDYLTNGFWANSLQEELPNPGLTVRFLIRVEDVSQKVLASLNGQMPEDERSKKIQEISKKLEDEATKGSGYDASVRSFYQGNEFYMFVYETYKDVRLVGTPPSAIGKFGGDTDNWMWPRHTGDFSIFRVYTGPDGKPAAYSKNNIPLKPRHYLPVSIKGVHKDDFAMILGYPGRTSRYLSSYGVKLALEETNPTIVSIRDKKLMIMKEFMDASEAVRIQYSSKYAGISNYWKYYIGQSKGLKRLKVYDKKKELESTFANWVNADPQRKEKYGSALTDLSQAYAEMTKYAKTRMYYMEALLNGCEAVSLSRSFEALLKELKSDKPDQGKIDEQVKKLKDRIKDFYKDYYPPTDKKELAELYSMAAKNMPLEFQPDILLEINKKYKGNFGEYAGMLFEKSMFADQKKLEDWLASPKAKSLEKDPAFKCMQSIWSKFNGLNDRVNLINNQMGKGNRTFVAGLREMQPERKFYPDANGTMRLTYGKVLDYFPADAVHYDFVTTLKGVMEKEDPKDEEFIVPGKLKNLYDTKDFGPYGENGNLVTCFLTTNDITGGNSGSPVINGDGELIGLAFDGNWEAMSGDIVYEPDLQRTICVDVRYVLFVIDKFAGAKNLISELKIKR